MNDEHSENFHEFLKRMYIEDSIDIYKRNANVLCDLISFEDIENVSAEEWNELWDTVKAKGIKLRKTADPVLKDKQINIFEKYTIEELKDLYSRKAVYVITQYFIDKLSKRNYDGHVLVNMDNTDTSFYVLLEQHNANSRIDFRKPRSKAELEKWKHTAAACGLIYRLLDENNVESDIYQFVFFNLQYATLEDMKKLIQFADNGFEVKRKGRKSRDKKIFKYDAEHNLLATYPNRNTCMEVEQVSKQSLYNVLSGKRKTLNGYLFEEEK